MTPDEARAALVSRRPGGRPRLYGAAENRARKVARNRARNLALATLADLHRDEYRALYAAARDAELPR